MTEDNYQISVKAQYINLLRLKDELEHLDGVLSDVIADHNTWLAKLRATRSVFLTLNNVKDAADRIQIKGDEDWLQMETVGKGRIMSIPEGITLIVRLT